LVFRLKIRPETDVMPISIAIGVPEADARPTKMVSNMHKEKRLDTANGETSIPDPAT
jgi:hypothetical protein